MTQPTTAATSASPASSAVYDKLKQSAQLLLPGLSTLYFGLSQIWGLPAGAEVTGTIAVVNVFVGVAITWLKSLHDATTTTVTTAIDGHLAIVPGEDGDAIRLTSIDPVALNTKDAITLQVNRPPAA